MDSSTSNPLLILPIENSLNVDLGACAE